MKLLIKLTAMFMLLLPSIAAAICVQGDCVNGQGTVAMPDGRRYVGEFQNGIRTGRGLMTFPDGTKYLGDWQNDKPHGQGTLSSAGKFEYVGEFANGVRQGQGTLETVDGKKYIGQWQNDVPHGQGNITYPDGSTFAGRFENGRRNGQGEATYADGSRYIGEWRDDLPNGRGTKINVNGEQYTGEFSNGMMHGRGKVVKPDGSGYKGQWQNDVLVAREEVTGPPEFSTVDETAGHVLAVVDEKAPVPAMVVESRAAAAPVPAAAGGDTVGSGAGYASVMQNGVYVRSGPSTEYRIIRSVNRGFPVEIVGRQANWSNVRDFNGQEGWIYAPLLGGNNSVVVNVAKVNLRSGPGLNFPVVDQLAYGTVLRLIHIQNDWYSVSTSAGIEGWLSQELAWPPGHAFNVAGETAGVQVSGALDNRQAGPAAAAGSPERAEETAAIIKVVPAEDLSRETAEVPGAKARTSSVAAVMAEPERSMPQTEEMALDAGDGREYAGIVRNGRGANIRSAPSLAAEVLRAVPPGYPVLVIERQGDWVQVEDFRGRKGWVYTVLLEERDTVVITVGKGNLRSNPSLNGEIVDKLDYGVVVFVHEERGDWLQVGNPEGLAGWLHRDVVWP